MSRIAIIGPGQIGSALAARFDADGIATAIANSRGPVSLVEFTAPLWKEYQGRRG